MPYRYQASLTRLVDGDTFEMTVDLGFRIFHSVRVQLLGVDAPEPGSTGAEGARQFVNDWFFNNPGPYELTTQRQDGFGRWISTVVAPSGANLADDLLEAGHGVAYES